MLHLGLTILTFSALLAQSASDSVIGAGLSVQTQQGVVIGTQVLPSVRRFLGIPFATAERWSPPSKPPVRTPPFSATSFGDACVQLLSPTNVQYLIFAGQNNKVTESENCLTINIWAPSTARKQKTAVLVWIYGGGFVFGASGLPVYDGQNFVRDNGDITIVTFNYRLNIFGQPNAPQLISTTQSQNFGLLDQEAAIQWLHDNIAAFGGDPNRLTLFGQSAGGVAVDAYAFSHPDSTFVNGLIEESGSLGLGALAGVIQPAFNAIAWNTASVAVGCGNNTTAAQFSCMKAVPFRDLENAVLSTGATFNLLTDNITIFSDLADRAAAGRFLKAPLLGGTTQNELDVFSVAGELATMGFAAPFLTEVISDIDTQATFTCAAGATAQQRLSAGVPTWRYQYQAVFPAISIRPDLRAFHGSEIPIVFGTYNASFSGKVTPNQISLSHTVQKAWIAFATDPNQGLVKLGWPVYNTAANTLVQIGNQANATGIILGNGTSVDATCSFATQLFNILSQFRTILAAV